MESPGDIRDFWLDKSPGTVPCYETIKYWVRRFRSENYDLEDRLRSGRPSHLIADDFGDIIRGTLAESPQTTTMELAELCDCSVTTTRTVMVERLGYRMLQCRWVPHALTADQKKARVEFCTEFLRVYSEGGSNEVYNLVTGDETWVRVYDPKVGLQGKVWVHFGDEAPEQPRRSHHQKKFMACIFFSNTGPVHCDMDTSNKKINSDYYIECCLNLMVAARKSRHGKTDIDQLVLHHDNARPHTSSHTTGYIKATGFKVLSPSPYSPDLAPCDFWLLPLIKGRLAGQSFDSVEAVGNAWIGELNKLTCEDFHACFSNWFSRAKQVVSSGGDYI